MYLTGIQIPFSFGYPSIPSYGEPRSIYSSLQRKWEPLFPRDGNKLNAELEGIAGEKIRLMVYDCFKLNTIYRVHTNI